MTQKIVRALQDERGIETLEWILIGGLIVAVAAVVYAPGGPLQTALTGAINAVSAKLNTALGAS
jgi:Flp pilus assembly pilin Flp